MIVRSFYSNGFEKTVDTLLEKEGARVVLKHNLTFADCVGLEAESMQMGGWDFRYPLFLLMVCWHPFEESCFGVMEWIAERLVRRLQLTEYEVIGIGIVNGKTDRLYLVVNRVHPGCHHTDTRNLTAEGRDVKPLWKMWGAGRRVRAEMRYQEGLTGVAVTGGRRKYRVLRPWNSAYRAEKIEFGWRHKGVIAYVPHTVSY